MKHVNIYIVDYNGNDIADDIPEFDAAVTIAEKLGIGYEVINRFGNSVYIVEEG